MNRGVCPKGSGLMDKTCINKLCQMFKNQPKVLTGRKIVNSTFVGPGVCQNGPVSQARICHFFRPSVSRNETLVSYRYYTPYIGNAVHFGPEIGAPIAPMFAWWCAQN